MLNVIILVGRHNKINSDWVNLPGEGFPSKKNPTFGPSFENVAAPTSAFAPSSREILHDCIHLWMANPGSTESTRYKYHKVYFLSLVIHIHLIFDILRLEAFVKWFFLESSQSNQFDYSLFHLISNFSRLFCHINEI
jgi:hypothetical protein